MNNQTEISDLYVEQMSEVTMLLARYHNQAKANLHQFGINEAGDLQPELEELAGLACVVGQKYIGSICGGCVSKDAASLNRGPRFAGGFSAKVINSLANHWKHKVEKNFKNDTCNTLQPLGIDMCTQFFITEVFNRYDYNISRIPDDLSAWRSELLACIDKGIINLNEDRA
jgi:hypothetical protein